MQRRHFLTFSGLALVGCGKARVLTVAAASDLITTFGEVGAAFHEKTRIEVVVTYGSTSTLARQIANGAPFDVYAAADLRHPDELVESGHILRETRKVFARGQLAVWAPKGGVKKLEDLASDAVRFVAVAEPDSAPYGQAAVEALKSSGLWDRVQPKLVYAPNVSQAKQFAATGNADASFVAYSLAFREAGSVFLVDAKLYSPMQQGIGVVASTPYEEQARRLVDFILGADGRRILVQNGYL